MALTAVDLLTIVDADANTAMVEGAVDEDVEAVTVVQGNCLTDEQAGWLICWLPDADSDHMFLTVCLVCGYTLHWLCCVLTIPTHMYTTVSGCTKAM